MKTIYVATTKNEHVKTIILNKLDNLNRFNIQYLATPQEVKEILYESYTLLIADKSCLNLNEVETTNLLGRIHYLDQESDVKKEHDLIIIYNSINSLKEGVFLYFYENNYISQGGSKVSITKNISKEVNSHKVETEKLEDKKVDDCIDKDKNLNRQNKVEHQAEKVEHTEEELEANTYPNSINLSPPYPEIEKKTLERLKEETNWYQGDMEENDYVSNNSYNYHQSQHQRVRIAKEIDKRSFRFGLWKNNKTIGIWSPLNSIGVTTFVVNFAIYMAKKDAQVAVVEALNNKQHLKNLLTGYKSMPKNWHSFAETLHNQSLNEAENVRWFYKEVMWLPLGDKDFKLEWDRETLHLYFETAKSFNFVLIDLPTGKMEPHTLDSLNYLDELWIMVDNDYKKAYTWKKYIHNILREHKVTAKMIFNHAYSFSKVDEIISYFELPLLAVIPSLHELANRSLYDSKPLIDYVKAAKQLKPSFERIILELLGLEPKKAKVIDNLKRIFV